MCKSFVVLNAIMRLMFARECSWTLHRKILGSFAVRVLTLICDEIILFIVVFFFKKKKEIPPQKKRRRKKEEFEWLKMMQILSPLQNLTCHLFNLITELYV